MTIPFGDTNDWSREIWVSQQISKLFSGIRLLDAGAGQLRYKKYCSHLNYISQDFGGYDGKGDGKGLQIGAWKSPVDIVSDIINIPEPSASFDAIICIEVFEHIPDPISALKELSRLLKSGGQLILTAPFASVTHYSPFHFYSGMNRYFFDKYLKEFGFKEINIISQGGFFEMVAQEIRRTNIVSKKYCNRAITTEEEADLIRALKVLEKLSKLDINSSELMCFGFRITATKS
jgi:ubiquinone/menaquinone biosynthesis C-methylase UbiE